MRILVALIVWAGAILGAAALSSAVADRVHQSQAGSASAPSNFNAGAVTATGPHSLFSTANFAPVLAKARSHLSGSKIERLVIYPGYLDVSAVRPGGEVDVYIDAVGRYQATTDPITPGNTPLFSLTRITPDMPAALGQRIATAAHIPQSELHYMIAERDSITHRFHWLIYMRPGSGAEYFETPGPNGPLFELRANSSSGLQRVRG